MVDTNKKNYKDIKICFDAIKNKLSKLNIDDIFCKEFQQYMKEKYCSEDLLKKDNLNSNKNQIELNTTDNNREFIAFNELNEFDLENFLEMKFIIRNETNLKINPDQDTDRILNEKIVNMKNSKFENFADKEKNYLEIIVILFKSVNKKEENKSNNLKNKLSHNNCSKKFFLFYSFYIIQIKTQKMSKKEGI